jgi:hypothetical protein
MLTRLELKPTERVILYVLVIRRLRTRSRQILTLTIRSLANAAIALTNCLYCIRISLLSRLCHLIQIEAALIIKITSTQKL